MSTAPCISPLSHQRRHSSVPVKIRNAQLMPRRLLCHDHSEDDDNDVSPALPQSVDALQILPEATGNSIIRLHAKSKGHAHVYRDSVTCLDAHWFINTRHFRAASRSVIEFFHRNERRPGRSAICTCGLNPLIRVSSRRVNIRLRV